jgi:hypothetical protein
LLLAWFTPCGITPGHYKVRSQRAHVTELEKTSLVTPIVQSNNRVEYSRRNRDDNNNERPTFQLPNEKHDGHTLTAQTDTPSNVQPASGPDSRRIKLILGDWMHFDTPVASPSLGPFMGQGSRLSVMNWSMWSRRHKCSRRQISSAEIVNSHIVAGTTTWVQAHNASQSRYRIAEVHSR